MGAVNSDQINVEQQDISGIIVAESMALGQHIIAGKDSIKKKQKRSWRQPQYLGGGGNKNRESHFWPLDHGNPK